MKLLIITQKVDLDDDVLGFFHAWLEEFAKQVTTLTVICLGRGNYNLPPNVEVLSLGKELGRSKLGILITFWSLVIGRSRDYDRVFVHMNPIYVVLTGWWWRLTGKKIGLWYTHRQVDWKLRLAEKFVHVIFTAAPESFRLRSSKVRVIGHGIEVNKFICQKREEPGGEISLLHVGRITPIKNIEVLIRAVALLHDEGRSVKLTCLGRPAVKSDEAYLATLKQLVSQLKLEENVHFDGSVPNREVPRFYCEHQISVNLCPTGGIDKAVLESMAAGTPVLVSNEAFRKYFGAYADQLLFKYRDPVDLAAKIKNLSHQENHSLATYLVKEVTRRASVSGLVNGIVTGLS